MPLFYRSCNVTYAVVQIGRAGEVRSVVVRPLLIALIIARRHVGRVGDVPRLVIHERRANGPVPDLVGPVEVLRIFRIAIQPRRQLEQAAVGYRVLHRVTGLVRVYLPSKTTSTARRVPALDLRVVYALREGEPAEARRVIRVAQLCGGHGGGAPEHLVVVAEESAVVPGHVVSVFAALPLHACAERVVVRRVAGVEPVLRERHHER